MISNDFKSAKKVVGLKQATKALENGKAKALFLAEDADERVVKPLLELSEKKQVAVEKVATMQELGRMCGIQVGAAAVALLAD